MAGISITNTNNAEITVLINSTTFVIRKATVTIQVSEPYLYLNFFRYPDQKASIQNQFTIDFNDVVSPVVVSATALQVIIDGYLTGGGIASPLTTAGDLYTFSTVPDRLPLGTNGQFLVANTSAAPPAAQWATLTLNATGGSFALSNAGIITMPNADASARGLLTSTDWNTFNGKLTNVLASANIFVGSAGNVATAVAMSGEASILNTGAVTLQNSAVIGKVLTGYVSGAGTVAPTDTILQAINKLNGNTAALVTGVSSVFGRTGAVAGAAADYSGVALTGVTSLNGLVVTANTGTVTAGVWNGTAILGQYGGTGVANTGLTITLAGNLVTTGAFNTTIAQVATGTYTLPASTSTLASLTLAETFATGVKTFNSSILAINNPANTFSYIIVASAITANRNLTLPLITGTDTLMTLGLAQQVTANKLFSSSVLQVRNASASTTNIYSIAGAAITAARTLTLPLATANTTLLAHNTGISGGTTLVGGTASGDSLTLSSTTNGTKGTIIIGSVGTFNEVTLSGSFQSLYFDGTGIAIGSGTITALVDIASGTGAVGQGQIKLSVLNTILAVPEQGVIENDGVSLYYTDNGSVRYYLPMSTGTAGVVGIATQTIDIIVNGTTYQVLAL